MTTLRILLDAPPEPDHEIEWALYADDGHFLQSGRATQDRWPSFDAIDFVLAAHLGRLVTVSLPPLPAARAPAAVRFALEDQLAGAPDDSHVGFAPQAADGDVRVAVVDSALMQSIMTAAADRDLDSRRIMLESDLAIAPDGGWCWCAAHLHRSGFARSSGGTTIAASAVHDMQPPEELVAALAQSGARRPKIVRADVDGLTASLLARATEVTGVPFVEGRPWRWFDADAKTFARAVDLQTGPYNQAVGASRRNLARVTEAGDVAGSRRHPDSGHRHHWPVGRAAVADCVQPGAILRRWPRNLPLPGASSDIPPAVAIAQRDAQLRHAAGQAARDDFVPLLGRIAPTPLASLPPGAVKVMRYGEGHIVFDTQQVDCGANQNSCSAICSAQVWSAWPPRPPAGPPTARRLRLMATLAQPLTRLATSPWWQSRSSMERKAIAIAGIAIAAVLVWMLLLLPMQRDTDVLVRQLAAARTSLAEARRQADDIATLARTTAAPTPGDARADLDAALARTGAKPIAIDRIDAQRLRVTFDTIGFDALVALLANLQRDGHLRAVELTATGRVEPGQVRAEMTLAR